MKIKEYLMPIEKEVCVCGAENRLGILDVDNDTKKQTYICTNCLGFALLECLSTYNSGLFSDETIEKCLSNPVDLTDALVNRVTEQTEEFLDLYNRQISYAFKTRVIEGFNKFRKKE